MILGTHGERGKWVGVEQGPTQYGEGCPLPSRLEGLGSVVTRPEMDFGVF